MSGGWLLKRWDRREVVRVWWVIVCSRGGGLGGRGWFWWGVICVWMWMIGGCGDSFSVWIGGRVVGVAGGLWRVWILCVWIGWMRWFVSPLRRQWIFWPVGDMVLYGMVGVRRLWRGGVMWTIFYCLMMRRNCCCAGEQWHETALGSITLVISNVVWDRDAYGGLLGGSWEVEAAWYFGAWSKSCTYGRAVVCFVFLSLIVALLFLRYNTILWREHCRIKYSLGYLIIILPSRGLSFKIRGYNL